MRKAIFTALLLVILCAGLGCGVTPVSPDAGPSIWTDKADYDPGEVVTIYGAGFTPGSVTLTVTRPDGETDQIPYVSADSAGSFTASYPLNGIIGTYLVNATNSAGQTAQTMFTDGATWVSVGAQVGTLTYGTAGSVTYTITVWGSGVARVSLGISGLPTGASATFEPTPIQGETNHWPTKTLTLTISTTDTTPAGKYTFTVHAGGHDGLGTLTIGAGCTTYYKDADVDNYGVSSNSKYLCAPEDDYTTPVGGDCDDSDAGVNPGATEVSYNGKDDDCNPATPDDDLDQDGYPIASDCDDDNAAVHPGASEVCNGIDDDCDGLMDEEGATGCTTYYKDADVDNYGITGDSKCICAPEGDYTATQSGDCDDADANEHPNQTWYRDADNDGYSDGTTDTTSCTRPTGYKVASELISTSGDNDDSDAGVNPGATEVPYNGKDDDCNPATPDDDLDQDGYLVATDCDDNDAAVHPGATEDCNGIDDDCDGLMDEEGATGCTTYYKDADVDNYGITGDSKCLCAPQVGYTATQGGDCDDADANEHPGQTWYKDADDDGYSDGTTDTISCTRPPGYKVASELISTSGDNDDNDAEVNPGATEVPYNGKDDDCNPATPDDDLDQDGYPIATDCDDNDTGVNPGATEVCNGIDDDCDGNIDEGVTTTYYQDNDGDTCGNPAVSQQACSKPTGYVLDNTDCDDNDANEYPGQTWYEDADDDGYSDGTTDTSSCTRPIGYKVASELTATSGDCDDNDANEHPGQTWYKDADDDGYSDGTTDTSSCTRPPGYKVASELIATSGDNDDNDAGVNPGATEVPYNGKDDDCNPNTPDDDLDQDGYPIATDCDDNDAAVNPGATEVPNNGKDDDCNMATLDEQVLPPPATGGGTITPGGGSTTPGGGSTTPGGDTDTPSTPSPKGGRSTRTVRGCFIATAAYGTPTAEQIDLLREFRDVVLLNNTVGSQFVALYYQLSPPIADVIAGNEVIRTLIRECVIDPIVWVVNLTGDLWRN